MGSNSLKPEEPVMNEFNKTKIVFSVGFLAALLAFSPLLSYLGNIGIIFLKFKITVFYIYWMLLLLLASSTYFYALSFLSKHKIFMLFQKVGDLIYALVLTSPIIFALIMIISLLNSSLEKVKFTSSYLDLINILNVVLSGIILITSVAIFKFAYGSLRSLRDMGEGIMDISNVVNYRLAMEILDHAQTAWEAKKYKKTMSLCKLVIEHFLMYINSDINQSTSKLLKQAKEQLLIKPEDYIKIKDALKRINKFENKSARRKDVLEIFLATLEFTKDYPYKRIFPKL